MMSEPPGTDKKQRQCHECGAWLDRLAVRCPECQANLPALGYSRRSPRGRRYVYGKRKPHLSQEAIWLLVVIIIGLLIVFGVQVLSYMRARKLIMLPQPRTQMVCSVPARWQPPAPAWDEPALTPLSSPQHWRIAPGGRLQSSNTIGVTRI